MSTTRVIIAAIIALTSLTTPASAQWNLNGTKIYYNTDNVGIGTSSPAYPLDVRTSAETRAIQGFATAATGVTYGVYARSDSTSGRGIVGLAAATTGINYGVYAKSDSTAGRGVYSLASALTGTTYAVYARSDSTTGRGIVGFAAATSGINYGVYGRSDSPDGFAGFFEGNVGVNGWIGTSGRGPVDLYSNGERAFRVVASSNLDGFGPQVIGGYELNTVSATAIGATIAGGGAQVKGTDYLNAVTADHGTIGGGLDHLVDGYAGTIAGGYANTASGEYSSIPGGNGNIALGDYSIVCGGSDNEANGNYSFAAGRQAAADHHGCFVWGDSTAATVPSSTDNQMTIRSSGGVRIFTNAGLTLGAELLPGETAWSTISDRNLKENIQPVDTVKLLERLSEIPVTTWNYTTASPGVRHIGPMAQDFAAAFNVGTGDTRISTIDADGVALAAIQGLHQLVKEKDVAIAQIRGQLEQQIEQVRTDKDSQIAQQQALIDLLLRRVEALEQAGTD